MDANSDIKRITDALDNLKQRHIGQYLENIVEFCQKEHTWDRLKTEAVLQHAIQAEIIYTAPSNNKLSYRKRCQDIIIQDNVKSVEIQTETVDTDHEDIANIKNDVEELKRFTHNEILSLRAQTYNGNYNGREDTHLKLLLKSFEERIDSLEKQLEEKQKIIEKLLDWPNSHINKDSHYNVAYPMREREECNKKCKEPKTKEPKNTNKENLNETPRSLESKKNKPKAKDPSEIQRKDVVIIGDSILNGLNEQGMRK